MNHVFASFFAACGLLCLTAGIGIIVFPKQMTGVSDGVWLIRGGIGLLFGALFCYAAVSAWRHIASK